MAAFSRPDRHLRAPSRRSLWRCRHTCSCGTTSPSTGTLGRCARGSLMPPRMQQPHSSCTRTLRPAKSPPWSGFSQLWGSSPPCGTWKGARPPPLRCRCRLRPCLLHEGQHLTLRLRNGCLLERGGAPAAWLSHRDERLTVFLASGPDDPLLAALAGPGGFATSYFAVCPPRCPRQPRGGVDGRWADPLRVPKRPPPPRSTQRSGLLVLGVTPEQGTASTPGLYSYAHGIPSTDWPRVEEARMEANERSGGGGGTVTADESHPEAFFAVRADPPPPRPRCALTSSWATPARAAERHVCRPASGASASSRCGAGLPPQPVAQQRKRNGLVHAGSSLGVLARANRLGESVAAASGRPVAGADGRR